jgi:hypothetical protein
MEDHFVLETMPRSPTTTPSLPAVRSAVVREQAPNRSRSEPAWSAGFKYSDIRLGNSWYPLPGFRLGVEVGYTMIDTAFSGQQVTLTKTNGLRPTGAYTAKDLGITSVAFRANRGFGGVGE